MIGMRIYTLKRQLILLKIWTILQMFQIVIVESLYTEISEVADNERPFEKNNLSAYRRVLF